MVKILNHPDFELSLRCLYDFGNTLQRLKFKFNPSFPDSLICVGSHCRQIGVFRTLKVGFVRLRGRRMVILDQKLKLL